MIDVDVLYQRVAGDVKHRLDAIVHDDRELLDEQETQWRAPKPRRRRRKAVSQ